MLDKQVTSEIVPPKAFPEHYREVVQRVRTAMTELVLSAGVNPAKSRDMARRFKLSKNLTWMVSKIVNSTDLYAVGQHIPGPTRVESLLSAMKKVGGTSAAIEKLRTAMTEFDRMVDKHTGDRATLELMVADMSPSDVQSDQLINSRKLAFQGNSGTLGVQAKVHMYCCIAAPDTDDHSMIDLVQVGGLFGFRRLRSSARWLLFRRMHWEDDRSLDPREADEALADNPDGVPLITEFCTSPPPKLDLVCVDNEVQYELPPGPVGNTAALTCVYGSVLRHAGTACRDKHNQFMELGCNLITPAETLVYDVLIHESMPWALNPELLVLSRLDGGPAHQNPARERSRLVVTETVSDLGRGAAALITPHMPHHVELVQTILNRIGWNADEFHALRITMPYPPIPATVLLSSELPES